MRSAYAGSELDLENGALRADLGAAEVTDGCDDGVVIDLVGDATPGAGGTGLAAGGLSLPVTGIDERGAFGAFGLEPSDLSGGFIDATGVFRVEQPASAM